MDFSFVKGWCNLFRLAVEGQTLNGRENRNLSEIFRQGRQRGFTFLEIIFVIAIATIISSVGFFAFDNARTRATTQETTYFMVNVQSAVRDTFFRRAATGEQVDIAFYLQRSGVITPGADPNRIEHPFGGRLLIREAPGARSFDIILEDFPVTVCPQIAHFNPNGQGPMGVGIGAFIFENQVVPQSIGGFTPIEAGEICTQNATGPIFAGQTANIGWRFEGASLVTADAGTGGSGGSGGGSAGGGSGIPEGGDVVTPPGGGGTLPGGGGSGGGGGTEPPPVDPPPSDGSIATAGELATTTHTFATGTAPAGTQSDTPLGQEIEVDWLSAPQVVTLSGPGNPQICVLSTPTFCSVFTSGPVTVEPGQFIRVRLSAPATVGTFNQVVIDLGGQTVSYAVQASS